MNKASNRDRSYDDIQVGEELIPLRITVTMEHIVGYQDFLGHLDPDDPETGWLVGKNLHIDEGWSQENIFGGVVGDGQQTGQYLCQLVTNSMPWGTLDAGYSSFDIKFPNPTRPGDVVVATGKVTKKFVQEDRQFVTCDVQAAKASGALVAVGTIKAFVPKRNM